MGDEGGGGEEAGSNNQVVLYDEPTTAALIMNRKPVDCTRRVIDCRKLRAAFLQQHWHLMHHDWLTPPPNTPRETCPAIPEGGVIITAGKVVP